ncbi:MAG: cytochrome c [Archangiaceae bacterium]|nr:cytochrome c [Archangiaceae bacterium]
MKSHLFAFITLFTTTALAGPPAKVDQALLDKGKAAFMVNCMACHGEKGAGDGPGAAALNPKPRNFTTDAFKQGETPDAVFKTVSGGVAGTAMVPFAHIPEDDRWALAHWVLELRKVGKPAAPAPAADKKPKK